MLSPLKCPGFPHGPGIESAPLLQKVKKTQPVKGGLTVSCLGPNGIFSMLSDDHLKMRRILIFSAACMSWNRMLVGAAVLGTGSLLVAAAPNPAFAVESCSDALTAEGSTTATRIPRSGSRSARSTPSAPKMSAFRLIGERLQNISSGTHLGAALYKLATDPAQSAWLKSPLGSVQPHSSPEDLRKGPLGPILRHLSEPIPVVYLVRGLSLRGRKPDKIVSVIIRDPIDEGFRVATLLDSQLMAQRDYRSKAPIPFGLDQSELATLRSTSALPTAEFALRLAALQQLNLIEQEQEKVQKQPALDAWRDAAPALVTDLRYNQLFERSIDPDYLTTLAMDRINADSPAHFESSKEHKLIGAIQLLIREQLAFIAARPGEQSLVPVKSIGHQVSPRMTDWNSAADQLYAALMFRGYFWDSKNLRWFSVAGQRSK